MQYLDLKAYFQEKFGNTFVVRSIRDLDAKAEKGKTNVIITELAGNIYSDSAQLPIQLDFYAEDPIGVSASINTFIVSNSGKMFVNEGNFITGYYLTPTPLDKNIEVGTQSRTRLTVFATFFVMFNMDDIASITVDGETVETLSRSMSYSADMSPDNKSGTELKKNDKIAGHIAVSFKMINKRGVFSQKLKGIRRGIVTGNTPFEVSVTFTDGDVETYSMLVQSSAFASARGQLPSMDIAFVLANVEE